MSQRQLYQAKARCRKCGGDLIHTEYRPGARSELEAMIRRCGRCGFRWEEAPLDTLTLEQAMAAAGVPSSLTGQGC